MSNILIKYMENRHHKDRKNKLNHISVPGPVITISREAGCPAEEISKKIIELISDCDKEEWTWISKEILEKSASELNLDPKKISYVFKAEKKSVFDEIISAFSSRYYKSDKKIRKTIAKVIYKYAERGKIIIIGRGGVSIAKDIEDSFHIRLQAPLEWKADVISKQQNISIDEAKEYVKDIDNKRKILIESFSGQEFQDLIFDASFNCAKMTTDEISEITFDLLKMREFCKKS